MTLMLVSMPFVAQVMLVPPTVPMPVSHKVTLAWTEFVFAHTSSLTCQVFAPEVFVTAVKDGKPIIPAC